MRSPLFILKFFLAVIFTGLLSYNFYIANTLKYEANGDAANFIELGLSLAKFQKYGNIKSVNGETGIQVFQEENIGHQEFTFRGHSTWRPPVWPFLIAGIFLLFGYKLIYILIFKFLLHLIGVFIFYRTLKLLKFQEVILIVGTFLYGISPAWQLYSRVFLSEPITFFFLTLWLYMLVKFIKGESGFLPQALVGGILILSHPYYVFLPFSIWLMLYLMKEMKLKIFCVSSLFCVSIVSVWIIRNMAVLHTNKIIITTSSGAVMAKGWNQKLIDEHTNTKGDLADEGLVLLNFDYNRNQPRNEVERMQLYKNATLHFISSNPNMILPIIGTKLLSAFNPFPETPRPGILETGRWLFQLFALLSLLYILIFTRNKLMQSLALGLLISTIGITILTYSGFRFRMPQVGLELLFLMFVLNDFLLKNKQTFEEFQTDL